MRKLICFAILNLIFVAGPSCATAISEQNLSIKKLFSIMGVDRQMNAGFEAMLPIIEQQAFQQNLTPSAKDELKEIYRNWFKYDINRKSIESSMIQLYADTFSEAEINELIIFYQSPVGRKFLAESPRLMKIGAKLGMEEARAKEYLLNQRLQTFFDVHAKQ